MGEEWRGLNSQEQASFVGGAAAEDVAQEPES